MLKQNILSKIAKNVINHIHEGLIITDEKGKIVFVNPAFEMVTGYVAEEVIGENPNILQSGVHNKEFYESMWNEIIHRGFWEGEIWNKRKNGELFVEWLKIHSIKDSEGAITNYVAIFSDITERKKILSS
ncbi:PAS domain-containing protein [Anoxybacteroides rupiense]|uniref:PAS domain-containing protein n=1 Tax=Anoxybacteroides rupiense TaxID=311460 RepID=UPI001F08C7C8|nr:PAS domain S-box protein [Anoxybacillus rupiensis]